MFDLVSLGETCRYSLQLLLIKHHEHSRSLDSTAGPWKPEIPSINYKVEMLSSLPMPARNDRGELLPRKRYTGVFS